MVDLETYSTKNNAVILTIGAIKFNRNKPIPNQTDNKDMFFYRRIDINSCLHLGLDIEEETRTWWEKQSEKARYEAIENPNSRFPIQKVLKEFSSFISDCKQIWSQGSFDTNILTEVYMIAGINVPFRFYNVRDSRTVFDLFNIDLKKLRSEFGGTFHNALDDCYIQLLGLYNCFNKL